MKVTIVEKGKDDNTKTRWARIHIESDDSKKKTTILVGASGQYCRDNFNETKEENSFEYWVKNVANKWGNLGDKIFEKDVHYDIYAKDVNGEDSVRRLLQARRL